MMTHDEAIKYCEEVAEHKKRIAELCKNTKPYEDEWSAFEKGAEKYRQLAEWLKELKTKREKLDKIAEYIDEMDMADMTRAEIERKIEGLSIEEIKDEVWQLFCLISDISLTLER